MFKSDPKYRSTFRINVFRSDQAIWKSLPLAYHIPQDMTYHIPVPRSRTATIHVPGNTGPRKSRYDKSNRVLPPHVKRSLEINDMAGIRMNKIYGSSALGVGGMRICHSWKRIEKLRRLQLGKEGAGAMHSYFARMQTYNSNLYHAMD